MEEVLHVMHIALQSETFSRIMKVPFCLFVCVLILLVIFSIFVFSYIVWLRIKKSY